MDEFNNNANNFNNINTGNINYDQINTIFSQNRNNLNCEICSNKNSINANQNIIAAFNTECSSQDSLN